MDMVVGAATRNGNRYNEVRSLGAAALLFFLPPGVVKTGKLTLEDLYGILPKQ
jgi:hypothetical protein